jgi:hypothetical protein
MNKWFEVSSKLFGQVKTEEKYQNGPKWAKMILFRTSSYYSVPIFFKISQNSGKSIKNIFGRREGLKN